MTSYNRGRELELSESNYNFLIVLTVFLNDKKYANLHKQITLRVQAEYFFTFSNLAYLLYQSAKIDASISDN